MSDLYNNIKSVCEARGITVSKLCLDLGLSKSMMSDLKAGRKKTLSVPILTRFADALGVSVGELLEGTKKAPTVEGERDEQTSMMLELWDGLSEADRNAVLFQLLKKTHSREDPGEP